MAELSALFGAKIRLFRDRCLNYRNCTRKCDNCIQACPVAAVSMSNDKPTYDELNCRGCGACRAVCPSEAFTVESFAFLREFSSLPSEEMTLGCTINDANRRDCNVSCYALLTEGEILYLLAGKKRLIFNTLHCRDCSFGNCYTIFKNSVDRVKDMLKADDRIFLTEIQGQNGGLGRRAFFQWFRQKTVTALAGVLPFEEKGEIQHLPRRRQSLLQGLKNLPGDLTEKTFVRRLNITSSCSGCGGCIKVCPNNAYTGDETKLAWQAKRCLNCGLCTAVCPEKAVSFGDFLSPAELLKETVSFKFSGNRCWKCGVYFLGQGETCPTCLIKAEQLEQNFDHCLRGENYV